MNTSVTSYLVEINATTDVSAGIIVAINQTVSNISQFTEADRQLLTDINDTLNTLNISGGFTATDRFMLEKLYNCTILGIGCYTYSSNISFDVWNYNGRYIQGELN